MGADKVPAGQRTDDENTAGENPNLGGSQATSPIQDRRAGAMTPTSEYDQQEEFVRPKRESPRKRGY